MRPDTHAGYIELGSIPGRAKLQTHSSALPPGRSCREALDLVYKPLTWLVYVCPSWDTRRTPNRTTTETTKQAPHSVVESQSPPPLSHTTRVQQARRLNHSSVLTAIDAECILSREGHRPSAARLSPGRSAGSCLALIRQASMRRPLDVSLQQGSRTTTT